MRLLNSQGAHFQPFCSTMSRFRHMKQFCESAPNNPKITCSRSKIPKCTQHPPQRSKFSSISLYDEPFSSCALFSEKCTERPQTTLTRSRSKIPLCMLHTPPKPEFSSVSLYNEPFSSYAPLFRKVYRMTPNDLNMFKVKYTNMQATYTPEVQICARVILR